MLAYNSPDSAWLKNKREAAGLTQQQLAEFIGWSQAMVAQVENGARPMPQNRVEDVERAVADVAAERAENRAQAQAIIDRFNREGWPEVAQW